LFPILTYPFTIWGGFYVFLFGELGLGFAGDFLECLEREGIFLLLE